MRPPFAYLLPFWLLLVSCGVHDGARNFDLSPRDSWEASAPSADDGSCADVLPALVLPLASDKRRRAIGLLQDSPVVPLSEADAADLLGSDASSAPKLMAAAIAKLSNQREVAMKEHKGSWSAAAEIGLGKLEDAVDTKVRRFPFLVRAIAGYEGTGGFSAQLCSYGLILNHISLGRFIPTPVRVPVVVFLERPPGTLYISWGVAA